MGGCLKALSRLGCLVLIVAVAAVGWWYRDPIMRAVAPWIPHRPAPLPPVADTSVGAPTPAAVASANAKLRELAQAGGPDSVVLNPNEVASLVGGGMNWAVRKMFDSLRVELGEGTVTLYAKLDTRLVPRDALGPLGGVLRPYEPVRTGGPVAIARPGRLRWTLDELSIRGVRFPAPVARRIAQRVAGADATGAVSVAVDPAAADVAVHPTALVLYRRRQARAR